MAGDDKIKAKVSFGDDSTYKKYEENNLFDSENYDLVQAMYDGDLVQFNPDSNMSNITDIRSYINKEKQKFNNSIDESKLRKERDANGVTPEDGVVSSAELSASKSDYEHSQPEPGAHPSSPNVFNPSPTKP
jgi:hypothetical protein